MFDLQYYKLNLNNINLSIYAVEIVLKRYFTKMAEIWLMKRSFIIEGDSNPDDYYVLYEGS